MTSIDLLTLPDARKAIRKQASDTSADADLQATYIPAATEIVEDIIGPVIARTGLTKTFDGYQDTALLLDTPITSVTSVVVAGNTLDPSGYYPDLPAGIIRAYAGSFYAGPLQSVVVTYAAGTVPDQASVPNKVKLAARIILAHLWQADQQLAQRPNFSTPEQGGVTNVPTGFAIPHRAAELLGRMQNSWGFA